jgi:hypothetical protein
MKRRRVNLCWSKRLHLFASSRSLPLRAEIPDASASSATVKSGMTGMEHSTLLYHTAVNICAFGGGSSLRKDDGEGHTTMLYHAARLSTRIPSPLHNDDRSLAGASGMLRRAQQPSSPPWRVGWSIPLSYTIPLCSYRQKTYAASLKGSSCQSEANDEGSKRTMFRLW